MPIITVRYKEHLIPVCTRNESRLNENLIWLLDKRYTVQYAGMQTLRQPPYNVLIYE